MGNLHPGVFVDLGRTLLFYRFSPDIHLKDGDELIEYGLDAKVVTLPGRSSGSIGILTSDGNLFCGDFFQNARKPSLNSIMDDSVDAELSVKKLAGLNIGTVYTGHDNTFLLNEFWKKLTKTKREKEYV